MKTKIQFTSLFIIFSSYLISGHFAPAYLDFSTNPYNPMNIYVTSATIDGTDLVTGDEIGIFDGNTCVGVGVVSGTISTTNMLNISASQQDPSESSDVGFTPGNDIILRFWDASIYKEGIVSTVTYLEGAATFSSLGSSYVSLSSTSSDLSLNELLLTENYHLQNIYPNPFNPVTNITYDISKNSNVKIDIFDISGKLVYSLINEFQPAGHHMESWDASLQPSGVYFLQLKTNEFIETKKITLLK